MMTSLDVDGAMQDGFDLQPRIVTTRSEALIAAREAASMGASSDATECCTGCCVG